MQSGKASDRLIGKIEAGSWSGSRAKESALRGFARTLRSFLQERKKREEEGKEDAQKVSCHRNQPQQKYVYRKRKTPVLAFLAY